MKKKKQTPEYNAIAIIGNGFDLAHGYKTSYSHFVAGVGEDFFANFRKYLDKYCMDTSNWNDFENRIKEVTLNCFLRFHEGDSDSYEERRADLENINKEFNSLQGKLISYLAKESARFSIQRLPTVRRYLSNRTLGLNFNYTDTAEKYLKNIYYVHGSLKENNIILGYDFRDEPCLAAYEEMKWSKSICRERLAFRRYIDCELNIAHTSPMYEQLIHEFDEIERMRCSSKGFVLEEDLAGWKSKTLFEYYLKEVEQEDSLDTINIKYGKIKKILVLGHSIKADKEYLSALLKKCNNLRKVVIFSYLGESQNEWEEKADFFRPYCKKIVRAWYACTV